jgi:hypothetical protein
VQGCKPCRYSRAQQPCQSTFGSTRDADTVRLVQGCKPCSTCPSSLYTTASNALTLVLVDAIVYLSILSQIRQLAMHPPWCLPMRSMDVNHVFDLLQIALAINTWLLWRDTERRKIRCCNRKDSAKTRERTNGARAWVIRIYLCSKSAPQRHLMMHGRN